MSLKSTKKWFMFSGYMTYPPPQRKRQGGGIWTYFTTIVTSAAPPGGTVGAAGQGKTLQTDQKAPGVDSLKNTDPLSTDLMLQNLLSPVRSAPG